MPDLAAEITEFLHGERRGLKPLELCRLVKQAAQHNDQWTEAPLAHWELAIEQAKNTGLIVLRGELLFIKPITAEAKPKQMGLLDASVVQSRQF